MANLEDELAHWAVVDALNLESGHQTAFSTKLYDVGGQMRTFSRCVVVSECLST